MRRINYLYTLTSVIGREALCHPVIDYPTYTINAFSFLQPILSLINIKVECIMCISVLLLANSI